MRILSWNIQWGRGANGQIALGRTIEVLRSVNALDAICLQEVACNVRGMPGGDVGDQVDALARAFPGWSVVYAPGVEVPDGLGGRACFGNLLLTRLPLGQVCRHMLPMPGDALVPTMRRSCIEAVVEAPQGALRLMTTHLEYYSAVQRAAQVAALRHLQAEAADFTCGEAKPGKESNPVFAARPRPVDAVLCGDFNFEPASVDYCALAAPADSVGHGWVDAWEARYNEAPHPPTVGLHGAEWPDRPYCCDFFWISETLVDRVGALQVIADTDASDHQPVVLELCT